MAASKPVNTDAERLLCATRALPSRDQLLIRLVCLEGLTLHEALRLTVADLNGQAASVSSKTGTRRVHALPSEVAMLSEKTLAGRLEGPLFAGVSGAPLRIDQARKIILSAMMDARIAGESLQTLRAQLLAA